MMLFNNLSPKAKRIVFNSIIVFTVMLFVLGYFIGKSAEKEENKNDKIEEVKNEGFSYSDMENDKEKKTENVEENEPSHEEYKQENPEVDFDENAEIEVNVLSNKFTQEQINEAKNVVQKFTEAYYPFDGNNPTQSIENAKPFVTEELLNKIVGQVVRPTFEYFSRKPIKIEVYEPYEPEKEIMNLIARVTGEVYNADGALSNKETVEYNIKLVPFENTFKINDYTYTSLRGDF